MHYFLEKIKKQVEMRLERMPMIESVAPNTLDFCNVFRPQDKPCVIAEIKFASPATGRMYQGDLTHRDIAKDYLAHGASALSVLAEPAFFQGDIQYIQDIRHDMPKAHILLKDFIVSEKQIAQGLMAGANAVLLIVAFLSQTQLRTLYAYALAQNITPVIEIHNEAELAIALQLDPKVIGVNNRNLKTLEIHIDTSRRLIERIPHHVMTICESGIQTHAHIKEMTALGFNGFLIGSHLMKHVSPGEALRDLLQ